ncbi:MTH1187 family thiamine-binding protein [Pleionea sp. CnH1-48]|uniref:MTH1187 family thiamine-binding protein n=1 Tax=Pleionea sp. CnH1-48 TaxID=2954494 RepID=UPI002097F7FA|nr:MTH1187 family thiamine-binding protein [Pleionea sp. CnH1-48]MCO7224054.1 MTH1187 family thiamine-binding protein [Pleionea sp. CnH1-48]
MKIIVDFCLIPIDVGLSLSPYIAECEKILTQAGLKIQLHAYGTNIEGEWDQVFSAIKLCHQKVHDMGAQRITTTIKMGSRTDKEQTMEDKVNSVVNKLGS